MEPKLKRKRRWKPRFDFVTFVYAGIGCGFGALAGAGIGSVIGGGVGAAIGAAIGAVVGAIVGFFVGLFRKSSPQPLVKKETRKQEMAKKPKKEVPQKPKMTEPPKKQPIQYLGNSNTLEIHDLSNTTTSCRIVLIKEDHKIYFRSIQEVEQAINNDGYNGCRWCLTKYHTD